MKYLIAVVALGLCTAGAAQSIISSDVSSSVDSRSSTSVTNSVTSNNSSSVTSSTNIGGTTSAVTNSVVSRNGSMCSAELNGRRCEITCRAPKVAQCGKAVDVAEPACLCK